MSINHTCGNKKTDDVYVVKASSSKDTTVAIDVPIDDSTAKDEVILVRRPGCVVLEGMKHCIIHAWRSGGHYLEYRNDTIQRTDGFVGLGIPKWHNGYVAPFGCEGDSNHLRNLLAQTKTLCIAKELCLIITQQFRSFVLRKFRRLDEQSEGS